MGPMTTVTAGWLAQRAAADDAARSEQLAAELRGKIRAGGVTLHDLGAGTGAMVRWLAPRLPGPQRWVLHDADAGILSHVELDGVVDAAGRPVAAIAFVGDLADLPPDAFVGASAVTASALLDVITLAEAERIVAACAAAGAPAFFSLTVTGSVRLYPAEPLDAALGAAFDDHQRRDAHGRRLLGPDAVPVVAALFDARGWNVQTASTPWRLGPQDRALVAEWLDGWVGAAVEQRPELAAEAAGYLDRRLRSAAPSVTVSHEDLLVWPS
jgi:hypothetical protein